MSGSFKVVTLQLLIIILIIFPLPFFKSFFLFVCSFCFSFSAFADEKDEVNATVGYRSIPQKNNSQVEEDIVILPTSILNQNQSHLLFASLPEIKQHLETLPLRTYQLTPSPGSLDFLIEIMPIVDHLSIVKNRFGVGLGFKIF